MNNLIANIIGMKAYVCVRWVNVNRCKNVHIDQLLDDSKSKQHPNNEEKNALKYGYNILRIDTCIQGDTLNKRKSNEKQSNRQYLNGQIARETIPS